MALNKNEVIILIPEIRLPDVTENKTFGFLKKKWKGKCQTGHRYIKHTRWAHVKTLTKTSSIKAPLSSILIRRLWINCSKNFVQFLIQRYHIRRIWQGPLYFRFALNKLYHTEIGSKFNFSNLYHSILYAEFCRN